MSDQLNYVGFSGSVEFSAEDGCLHGKVLDIDSLIVYSGESVLELKSAFEEAVDDYLADCRLRGVAPEKAYNGTFNIRVGAELHRKAVSVARRRGQSLNELVKRGIWSEVIREDLQKLAIHQVLTSISIAQVGAWESTGYDQIDQTYEIGSGDFGRLSRREVH